MNFYIAGIHTFPESFIVGRLRIVRKVENVSLRKGSNGAIPAKGGFPENLIVADLPALIRAYTYRRMRV